MLLAFALTWLTVALGLAAGSVETASNTPMLLILLPFLSSGFVPTDRCRPGCAWFAEHQPFTPIIETPPGLTSGADPGLGPSGWAIGWCVLITVLGYLWARRLFTTGPDEQSGHWLMLTIGQLASYAGVTVRAVRHYHASRAAAGAGARRLRLPAVRRHGRGAT